MSRFSAIPDGIELQHGLGRDAGLFLVQPHKGAPVLVTGPHPAAKESEVGP